MPVLLLFLVVVDVAPGDALKDSTREEAIPPFISSSRPHCNPLGPRGPYQPCLSSLFLLKLLLDEAEGPCP